MKHILLILLVFSALKLHGQQQDGDDFNLWTSLQVNWKLDKNWTIKLKNQERFSDDEGFVDLAYFQGEIGRDLFKRHKLFVRYRFTTEADEEHNINRFSLAYGYKRKVTKRLALSERLMYQYEQRVFTREPFVKLRNKVTMEYELDKRNALELEYELFLQEEMEWDFDKHRMALKYNRELSKKMDLRLAGRLDYIVDRVPRERSWILELGFRYKL